MRHWLSILLLFSSGRGCAGSDCLTLSTATVRASDLAGVAPAFASLDPDMPLAAAPLPGVRRVVGPREVLAWARNNGVELEQAPSLCLERAVVPLSAGQIEQTVAQALVKAFGGEPGLSWKLVSFRPLKAPPGALVLLRGGLVRAGAARGQDVHQWRGRLTYDGGQRSLPLVIQLRLSHKRTIASAVKDLAAGTRLEAGQTSISEIEESPLTPVRYADPSSLAARVLRRAVASAQHITLGDLVPVYEVARGGSVIAEVQVGGARLAVPAVAETNAREGQRVLLRNPETKRVFAGRALGSGRVQVEPIGAAAQTKRGDQ